MEEEAPTAATRYRMRANAIAQSLRSRAGPARIALAKKREALNDMARNEDWLAGKQGSQLEQGKALAWHEKAPAGATPAGATDCQGGLCPNAPTEPK